MKRIVRLVFIFALILSAVLIIISGVGLFYVLGDLPKIDALKEYHPPQSTLVYDRKGIIIGRLFDERRTVVSLNKLPRYLPLAFVAAEDGDFFEHRGIDYIGLLRAIILEIKFKTIGGRRVGGSTITQQTARAMLLSSNQTYIRKLKEIILAKRIEDALSKEEILILYLNQIYFGNGAYGIEEAALTYFDKPAKDLNIAESALLASVPKSPNRINPFGDTERIKQRQIYVLDQMLKHDFIDLKTSQKAKDYKLFDYSNINNYMNNAPYFLNAVKAELISELGEDILNKGGLKIYSTLDSSMQKVAQEALEEGLRDYDKQGGYRGPIFRPSLEKNQEINKNLTNFKQIFNTNKNKIWNLKNNFEKNIKLLTPKNNIIIGARVLKTENKKALIDLGSQTIFLPPQGFSWTKAQKISDILKPGDIILVKLHDINTKNIWASLEQEPIINGGLVALDVQSGDVLAMVGGYDFQASSFNRITQSKRQPGSAIKPLLYAAALEEELFTANSIITDAPKAFYDQDTQDFWRPRNSTNNFLGDITLRRCLRSSINTCSIEILNKFGVARFVAFAKKLNISNEQTPWTSNLTLALGSGESIAINLANAMRILPNAGLYSPYRLINSYKLSSGEQVYRERVRPVQVIRPGAAYITTHILQDAIGPARKQRSLYNLNSDVAGKTGTTNEGRSLSFYGYTPSVLAAVYVGFDDNRSMGHDAWGISGAYPSWARFMNNISQPEHKLAFKIPDDVEWHEEESPELGVIKEVYLAGTAPEQYSLEEISKDNPPRARMPVSRNNNKDIFAP